MGTTKQNFNKYILYISIFLNTIMIIGVFVFAYTLPFWANLILQFINIFLFIAIFICRFYKLEALFKLNFTFIVIMFFMTVGYIVMDFSGVFDRLSNMELIKNFILGTGIWGIAVYVLVQIIQVVFLPIPAIISNLVGVALYGPTKAFLLSSLGVFIGSLIAFGMGRIFGSKLVIWIAGKENAMKYRRLLSNKGKYLLILMLLFPMFPDDVLCMVAGLTTMSWRYFILIILLTRPVTIAVMCYMGTGEIIPFSGWGIVIWIAIFASFLILFILLNKYKTQITNFFSKIFYKQKIRSRKITKP